MKKNKDRREIGMLVGIGGRFLFLAGAIALLSAAGVSVRADGVPANASKPAPAPEAKPAADAQISQVMDFFKETDPETYDKATVLQHSDPQKFNKLISDAAKKVNELKDLREKDPDMFRDEMKDLSLTHKSLQLSNDMRRPEATPDQIAKDKVDLTQVVTEQFVTRQHMRQLELDRLTARLESLKKDLADRESHKDEIVEKRVKELTQQPRTDW